VRALSRGGTGMTMGEYNQALYNPALINRFDENDDFSFAVNAGVIASDQDGFIEGAEDVQDLIGISGKLVQIDAGGSMMVAIPNNSLPMAFIGTAFQYDGGDRTVIENIADGTATQDDLNSTVNASLLWLAEYGLMIGKGFELAGVQFDGSATVKIQTIELIAYADTIANFDAGDVADSDNLKSHSGMNVDLGVTTRVGSAGQFVLAGTIENLIPQSYAGPNGSEYDMAPVLTAAAGYNGSLLKAEFNMDLTQRNGYDLLLDTQFARLGVELSAGRHFHLRVGYRTDLKGNVSDLLTAGIGITPSERVNIDIGGGIGEGDTYAAGVQLGFKI
jgi:hypothetical protein